VVVGADIAVHGGWTGGTAALLPRLDWTAPILTWAGILGIALPLYVVTMAGQNVPGVAIMKTYGYEVPWRETMAVTGIGTVAGAMAGGHVVNLAAITASLAASPDAHPDPRRRWIASATAGWAYLVLALASAAFTAFVSAASADVVGAVAGLALLGTLASSLSAAFTAPPAPSATAPSAAGSSGAGAGRGGAGRGGSGGREAAAVTFVVAASGLTFGGVGAGFWALAAGLIVCGVLRVPALSAARGERHS
jgi:benzoate membrane transport protein